MSYVTGTVHPQIKNTYLVVLLEYKCLPSLDNKGMRLHWDMLMEERLVHFEH